jgi:hypothetical protein
MSKGGTVFVTDLQPAISTETLSVGTPTSGTLMSGAIVTGVTQISTAPSISPLPPSPDTTIDNIYTEGNATCGTFNFDFKNIGASTSFEVGFPSEFKYTSLPVVITSAGNAAAMTLISTGGAYINSYKVPLDETIKLQIEITKNVTSAARQTATFNYAVFGTTPA